jgi:hypothetical protein
MLRRPDLQAYFSEEDIPVEYLSLPIEDRYSPTYELFNAYRRSQPDFNTLTLAPNSEKLFRLYFYQGMSKPDRLIVHSELLENNASHYFISSTSIALTLGVYICSGFSYKYQSFTRVRVGLGLLSGWVWYDFARKRAIGKLMKATTPLYEKYQVK